MLNCLYPYNGAIKFPSKMSPYLAIIYIGHTSLQEESHQKRGSIIIFMAVRLSHTLTNPLTLSSFAEKKSACNRVVQTYM